MRLVLYLCALQYFFIRALAVFSTLASKKILGPVKQGSYFGYDIAYVSNNKSLIISAPVENNIGKVYVCDTSNFKCKAVRSRIMRENDVYDHDYWLGATVEAGPSYFVNISAGTDPTCITNLWEYLPPTCAPRLIYNKAKGVGTTGGCYMSKNGYSIEELSLHKDTPTAKRALEQEMTSYGWSLDISDKNTVVVGGPAMFTGRSLLYTALDEYPHVLEGIAVNVEFDFGYSVTSGYFTSATLLMYAISSPYGYGQVLFYDHKWRPNNIKFKKPKVQVGEMFGATLCSARMFGRRSDLLVGAPARPHQKRYNVGAVYVFTADKLMILNHKRLITGYTEGSMFGSAIINTGDLNGDGKDDIAIAAPFDKDGKGAVYIYCGASIVGLNTKKPFSYLQVLESETYGFGLGLSVMKDYDENGCNELAVGSPFNNTVHIYPCFAFATVEINIQHPDLQNRGIESKSSDRNATHFLLKSCLHVKFQEKPINGYAELNVEVKLSGTNATLCDPHRDGKYVSKIKKTGKELVHDFCEEIGVYLPPNGHYGTPIKVEVTATQLNNPKDQTNFDPLHVIVHENSKLTLHRDIWAATCQNKEACRPDIKLNLTSLFQDPYELGSSETEDITLSLRNDGEVAYSACLKMEVSNAAIVQAPALSCTLGNLDHFLTCYAPKPIHKNDTWDIGRISLRMTKATNKDELISVKVKVLNNCQTLQNSTSIEATYDYKLTRTLDDVEIVGRAPLGSNVTLSKEDIEQGKKQLDHIYTIRNKVPNAWLGGPMFKITITNLEYIKYSKTPIIALTHSGHSLECTMVPMDKGMVANCTAEKLERGDDINVVLNLVIDPSKLNEVMSLNSFEIESKLEIIPESLWNGTYSNESMTHSIKTKVAIEKASVATWIIIVACLLGLLLLALICCIVIKRTTFLRRKNKEKTKILRKSIRRQTIRRSMMAQSAYNRLSDQEQAGGSGDQIPKPDAQCEQEIQ